MTTSASVGVGIVGAGYISDIYLKNCTAMFDNLRVVGIADLVMDRARAQAEAHGIEAFTVDALIVHADVEIIVNLTIPAAHGDVAMAAVEAGKSVYNEKPLTASREQGQCLLHRAGDKGVLVGGAPDTFLGGGSRPFAGCWTRERSAHRWQRPGRCCPAGTRAGTPIPIFTISREEDRCSIWVLTT